MGTAQYYAIGPDGKSYGPIDMTTLQAWVRTGSVQAETIVVDAATGLRQPAHRVPGLAMMFGPPARQRRPASSAPMSSLLRIALASFVGFAALAVVYVFATTPNRGWSGRRIIAPEEGSWSYTFTTTSDTDPVLDTDRFRVTYRDVPAGPGGSSGGTWRSRGTGSFRVSGPGRSYGGGARMRFEYTDGVATVTFAGRSFRIEDNGSRLAAGGRAFDLTERKVALEFRRDGTVVDIGDQGSAAPPAPTAYATLVGMWRGGHQADAERLAVQYLRHYPDSQPITFFAAACVRSEFDLKGAARILARAVALGPQTAQGQCAAHIVAIDAGDQQEIHFVALRSLARSRSDDPLILWMLAVECRQLKKNAEGVEHYRTLLARVGTGSSLVHRTYANLLDEVGRHKDALPHRYMACRLEPAEWSYNGLAATLETLGYREAASHVRMKLFFKEYKPLSPPAAITFSESERRRIYLAHYSLTTRLFKERHVKSLAGNDPALVSFEKNHHLTDDQMGEIEAEGEHKRWFHAAPR